MATPSHAVAVKSLNKSSGRRRFVFKTFSQRIEDIDINVFRSLDKVKAEPSKGSSFFRDCLTEWRELNTAEDFISLYEEITPLVQTLPLILFHRELIFSKLLLRLQMKARLSLEPILRLIADLSRDLLEDFLPFLRRIADSLVSLLESGADREPDVVEQIFTSWSYIMMYLQKYLVRDIRNVLRVTVNLRYYPKDYVQEFMAEATSFLLRNAPGDELEAGIRKIMLEVVKKPSPVRKSGASALVCYVMRGISSGFHSRAERVLKLLMSQSIFSIGEKLNEGSETIVEVVIAAFQRICDYLGSKELIFMWDCFHREIIDSVNNGCLLHLSRLLSLLFATVEIDNGQGVSDYRPMLELVDVLAHTFITPSNNVTDVDNLYEVVDRVLQLMLCVLDGLHEANKTDTITYYSLQWAPAFELKNSSSLKFVGKLLQKDPRLVYTFRTNILSAMNDLIENSQEEVICLLLSFFGKLQKESQCCDFLDGVSEGQVSRIHGFFQESICFWIRAINDIAHQVSSCIEIDEAKLALLWGIIRCYPHIMDMQAHSSLLMKLIDALHLLSVDEAEPVAGVSKHIWQSLIGASLNAYRELLRGNKFGLEETAKVLYLAKTCKSSSKVLCAVADYLDFVHGNFDTNVGTTLPADNSHKKFHPELEAKKVEDAVVMYADNLCHSDKAIRVPTLRILCHYEPITYENSMMDQPPEKKMKTETGVSRTSPVDCRGGSVVQLLLSIEETPLSISTSRKVILLISRIQMDLTSGRISETYIPLVLNGVLGILHNRFSYLWNPASECLAVLISEHVGFVWDKFVHYFQCCQSVFQRSQDQCDRLSSKLSNKSNDLVELFHFYVSLKSDSTPHAMVLSLLLQSMQKVPSVIEARSRQVIPLFFDFLGYNRESLVSAGTFNSCICKGKEWKGVLKEWLNLLKLLQNPKSFYKNQFLKDILHNRLLDENDAEIQMKVLDCLLMWKDDFLTPYDQQLKNLINSKNLREELTTWSLSRESHLIDDGHRFALVPLVVRLLLPKVRKLKTLASRKHASIYHRKAVLGFIAQLDIDELPLFFALLIKSLQVIPKGADDEAFWDKSYWNMTEFQEFIFSKYFTIENLASLSWKKSHGFLHVIEDVVRVFDELHVGPFLNLLIGCVVRVLASCTSSLELSKGCESTLVENHTSKDPTSQEKDNPTINHGPTSSSQKQLKDLRSLCLRILSAILSKYEDHDYDSDFWDLFFMSVKPLIDAFKQEGSSSEKPSSLFSCFLAMSRSHRLVSLLHREKNLVPDIFSILTVMTASEAIISSVLKFIENLLTLDSELDDEDTATRKVLRTNLEILICSLHCHFQSSVKRKLVNFSGETAIRIFKLLSRYIKDPLAAMKFVDILLPFLGKGVKNSEVSVKSVQVLRDIIPLAGTGSTRKVLKSLSPLLASVELDMRSSVCDLLDSLAKADPSVFSVAKLVSELNATSAVEMGGLDYDSIVTAYERIDIDLFHSIEVDHAVVILSHCVHDMSSEEMILRHSAYRSLLSYVEFSSLILDRESSNAHEAAQTVDEGLWTEATIQRIVNKFILKHMGEAMTRGSNVKKEWIDLLRDMVLKLPQLSNLNSLKDLCSADSEVDFFKNIIHLQKHRRARALTRFRKVISTSNVSEALMNKVFVPLFFNMLFDVQDENFRSACSEALASISAHMGWKSYSALLMKCFKEMEKNPQKQKILLRLFCSILDKFHFSQLCSSQEFDAPPNALGTAPDSTSSSGILDKRQNCMVPAEIKKCLQETVLPKLQKLLYADSDKANVDISRAALKLLKLLPEDIMDSQLPSIIHRISNFLKNRSDSVRNSARIALADCLKELGLEYLQFIVQVLQATLKRGYELHVMGYTLNFILSKSLSRSTSCKLDYCLGELLSVVKNDILGNIAEQKEVEKIASKMIETKKQKSFETLELIARNITFRSHASKLLSVVKDHLQNHLTPKVKSKLESMLNHIADGIECNPSVDQVDLFVFIYGLVKDGIEEENNLHSNSSSKEAKDHKNGFKGKTMTSARVIVAKSTCSHLITVFALRLLHKRLKKLKLKKDDELLSMLDSFVTLLGKCLSSKYEDILSASLRCLTPLGSLPLPSLESQADKIKATLLDIAQSSATSSSPLMQSCLSLLTKLLRTTNVTLSSDQLHRLIQFPLFVDLERNPSDVALSLLKAIVNRKLVVHEIYDLVIQVAELMVTSQEESIRKKCSNILLQFLLDYHLSDKRLQQHVDFLLANLSYEHPSGREAILEMLHVIIKKFPQTKVDEQSHTLFVHLVARLVNDPDSKVRSMIGVAVKLLIGRISPHSLDSILEYSLSWYLGRKQQLCSAGAQVLGLLVEVMKKDFQKHINSVLPVTRSILQSSISVAAEREQDLHDESTIPFWKEAYYSLVLLEKIFCQFPDLLLETHLELIWEAICELLLHPHMWLRNRSNRLVALYFTAVTESYREDREKSLGAFFLMKPSRLNMIAVSLCCQLETQVSFDDAVSNWITQNLVSTICNMLSFKRNVECSDLQNFWSTLGEHEQGLFLRAFQLLNSRKGKGWLLSFISGTGYQNDQDHSGDFQYLLVSNLLKRLGKIALQKEATQIVFNTFRLISSEISQENCQCYVNQMLPSLYKVCEGFAGKKVTDDQKQLAQEVCDSIRDRVGSQTFVQVYNEIRKNLKAKRDKRKQEVKLMAVVNPMRNAKRKLRIAAKHRVNKKRKMMTMKMGRWVR